MYVHTLKWPYLDLRYRCLDDEPALLLPKLLSSITSLGDVTRIDV